MHVVYDHILVSRTAGMLWGHYFSRESWALKATKAVSVLSPGASLCLTQDPGSPPFNVGTNKCPLCAYASTFPRTACALVQSHTQVFPLTEHVWPIAGF